MPRGLIPTEFEGSLLLSVLGVSVWSNSPCCFSCFPSRWSLAFLGSRFEGGIWLFWLFQTLVVSGGVCCWP